MDTQVCLLLLLLTDSLGQETSLLTSSLDYSQIPVSTVTSPPLQTPLDSTIMNRRSTAVSELSELRTEATITSLERTTGIPTSKATTTETTIIPETTTTTVLTETTTSITPTQTTTLTILTDTPTSTILTEMSIATILTETSTSTILTETSTSTILTKMPTSTILTEMLTSTIPAETTTTISTIPIEVSTSTAAIDTTTFPVHTETTSTITITTAASIVTPLTTTTTTPYTTTPERTKPLSTTTSVTSPTTPVTTINSTIFETITCTTASMTTNMTTTVTTTTTLTTTLNCLNGGSLENGMCICQDKWTGETCEKENFCKEQSYKGFTFSETIVGQFSYSKELCEGSINDGIPQASARCMIIDGSIKFSDFQKVICDLTLDEIQKNISGIENKTYLAVQAQILTSRPEVLSAENISVATQIATTVLTSTPDEKTAIAAVATVSQLLNADNDKFTDQSSGNNSDSLTEALQKFSVQSTSDTLMVQPNLAVQSASVSEANSRGVQFSLIGDPKSFMASRIHFNPNASQLTTNSSGAVQIFIQFPSGQSHKTTNTSVGFVLYQNDKLFRSKVFISELHTNRIVISGQLSGKIIPNHVEISFKPEKVLNASLRNFACVFWNYTLRDWSSYGCSGKKNSLGHLQCQCNHTTNFVVLMSFRMNYAYVDVLNTITIVGCCISIIGLSLTIIYQIMTRKSRKTKPTLLLVSICMSLLMFYVLFIFGITNKESTEENSKNSNEIPTSDLDIPQDSCCCTVFTVFLQYFLLATFTWTTIYSIQLFLLLKCTFNQLHRYFTAIVTVTGWGFPAIVVAITLGATYRVDNPLGYRQEEFCWLAALDREKMFDIRKPMLWGFLFPVALMLSFNTGILVYFTVTQCRTNPDLKSTQKTPILKKFLSSLSLAVVLSITWVIGYLHLVEENYVLAIIFCLLTTTQGFQIFIFFTVRTSAFRKHVRNILHSVFTLIPMHHQKYNLQLHRKTRPKATYKNVDSNISSTA